MPSRSRGRDAAAGPLCSGPGHPPRTILSGCRRMPLNDPVRVPEGRPETSVFGAGTLPRTILSVECDHAVAGTVSSGRPKSLASGTRIGASLRPLSGSASCGRSLPEAFRSTEPFRPSDRASYRCRSGRRIIAYSGAGRLPGSIHPHGGQAVVARHRLPGDREPSFLIARPDGNVKLLTGEIFPTFPNYLYLCKVIVSGPNLA